MTDAATTREANPPAGQIVAASEPIRNQPTDADRAADSAWLDAPAASRRDLIYRAYRHIDMVAAVGIDGIAEKRDRDRIIKAREDLHTALYGGRS